MSGLSLLSLREALEGGAPAVIATCAPDGTPNVSYLSDAQYVDERHLALSYQFFNKTRANVLANSFVRILIIHPETAQRTRILAQYVRTEESGALFERMRARLAGIASHEGMADVFRLRGADVYRVLSVEPVPCLTVPVPPRPSLLPPLRATIEAIVKSREMDALLDHTLGALEREFGIAHSMILTLDPATRRLYAVAIRGYERRGGIGAEVREGEGVIGIAAEVGCPIRIPHALAEHAYARAVRAQAEEAGLDEPLGEAIPLPGLPSPGSQMAVPIRDEDRVTGVLYVEDAESQRFRYDDEDALAAIASALGLAMRQLEDSVPSVPAPRPGAVKGDEPPRPLRARYFPRQCTVFVDDEYVIKGVAGAVLWKLLQAHAATGRSEFTSRELREDPSLQLPELCDNLAARLILLQRRLDERDAGLYLRKSGRGRVLLEVRRPLELVRD